MATYYTDYKNGNDTTGNGQTATPWKTVAKALTIMGNNDTVLLRGSDANDEVYYERSLVTALTGITIKNDTGHTPVMSPADIKTSWAATGGTTNVYETALTTACYGVWNGSTRLTLTANIAACDALTNSYYFDDPGNMLYVNIGGAAPTFIQSVSGANEVLTTNGGGGLTWDGVDVQWFIMALDLQNAPTVQNATFQYCVWPFANFHFVRVDGNGVNINNCTFVDDNLQGNNGLAILIENTASNCEIDTVSITGINGYGISVQGGAGFSIHDCTCVGMGDGISISADASGNIYHNIIYDTLHGFIALNSTHTGTVNIYRNTFYFTADPGAGGTHGIVMHSTGIINAYHNVVAWLNRGTGGEAFYISSTNGGSTITIKNNIMYECIKGIIDQGGGGVDEVIVTDYNCFYNCTNDFVNISAGEQGTHNVTSDPLFTNSATYDFTLTESSPCRNVGVAVAGINDDYKGAAPDIGRYEYDEIANDDIIPILLMMGRRMSRRI